MDVDERALTSADFPVHWPVLTRWADNDMFGHLNNAVYYELAFPDALVVGLAVTRLGTSSVTYRLALFAAADGTVPVAAVGHWVHVYVDRTTRRPVPIPEVVRDLLATAQR